MGTYTVDQDAEMVGLEVAADGIHGEVSLEKWLWLESGRCRIEIENKKE